MESTLKLQLRKTESLIVLSGYIGLFLIGAGASLFHIDLMKGLDTLPHVCLFRLLTGFKCVGCGLTHAFLELSRCKFASAFHYHPFSPFLFVGGIVWLFYPHREQLLPKGKTLAALVCAMCIFWLVRNIV